MPRSNYLRELQSLHVDIINMGSLVEKLIEDSIKAFITYDTELCTDIISRDKEINETEKKIESKCLWLIAKEQPIASDLRDIATALKMITDMERIGDHAADIAELTMRISDKNTYSGSEHIRQMANVVINMVHDAVLSYLNTDLELATRTIKKDDEADEYFNTIKNELVEIFRNDEGNMDNAIDYLLIAKYLERIGDHAVNICEWVEFSKTGKHKNTRIF